LRSVLSNPGVNAPALPLNELSAYCAHLRSIHPAKLALDRTLLAARPSPFPLMANSLFSFMAQRYVASYALLGCQDLLKKPVNVTLTIDAAGVVIDVGLPG
jgi:hypothetical protein